MRTNRFLQQRYWLLNARNLVRQHIHKCNICFRNTPKPGQQQIMADLPMARGTQSRPFSHTGVDYAGPIQLKIGKGRGNRRYTKGYICVFICMATKAMHLEAVTDLSTQHFIAVFKRFISRRGLCQHIYSDNGSNFVGAASELPRQQLRIMKQQQQEFAEILANDGIEWHFNQTTYLLQSGR